MRQTVNATIAGPMGKVYVDRPCGHGRAVFKEEDLRLPQQRKCKKSECTRLATYFGLDAEAGTITVEDYKK